MCVYAAFLFTGYRILCLFCIRACEQTFFFPFFLRSNWALCSVVATACALLPPPSSLSPSCSTPLWLRYNTFTTTITVSMVTTHRERFFRVWHGVCLSAKHPTVCKKSSIDLASLHPVGCFAPFLCVWPCILYTDSISSCSMHFTSLFLSLFFPHAQP